MFCRLRRYKDVASFYIKNSLDSTLSRYKNLLQKKRTKNISNINTIKLTKIPFS